MTTAKYDPAGNAILAQTDVGTPVVNFQELILSGDHTSGVTTITCTTNIPAAWPTVGRVAIDTEVIFYTGKSTNTLTGCTRGAESTTAAAHTAGAVVGMYWTADQFNQLVSEIIAIEQARWNPNLVLNSDFGRRTVFGLAMPEVFADNSAWNSASTLSIAGNALTIVNANNWAKWNGSTSFWRDGRWSAQFKAVSATGTFVLAKYVDVNDGFSTGNCVYAYCDGTNFFLKKFIAGAATTVASVAQTMTLNNRYWIELEAQGTTYIAKFYSSGAAATTKAAATLVQTLSGTVADAGVASGGVGLWSNQANSVWGEQATSPGGVYVETWLPESWAVTFGGTLGGQAVGYDDSADSGPLNKQWTPSLFFPKENRSLKVQMNTVGGSLVDATNYTASFYAKMVSIGSGTPTAVASVQFKVKDISGSDPGAGSGTSAFLYNIAYNDSSNWTRRTSGATPIVWSAGGREFQITISDGGGLSGAFTNALVKVDLLQLEQGSAATAWRNAPADDGGSYGWSLEKDADSTTTSVGFVEIDSRDYAANVFLPADATVDIDFAVGRISNSGVNQMKLTVSVDGANEKEANCANADGGNATSVVYRVRKRLAAGKHRIAVLWGTVAGTATILGRTNGYSCVLLITASRGR